MAKENESPENKKDDQKKVLDKRLESIGWALFLIMIGCLWLMPKEKIPEGTWVIGTGVIILGLTLVRYIKGIKIIGFWVILGILALAFGISDFFNVDLPLFPILLIIIGANIILKPLMRGKKKQ